MTTLAWVIGARGLLGSSLVRSINRDPLWAALAEDPLPWADDRSLADRVQAATARLVREADGQPWSIIWAAGRAVTSSSEQQFETELTTLRVALDAAAEGLGSSKNGSIFFASSAGGIYAGSADPPFSETTEPRPISGYGDFKLRAEQLVAQFCATTGTRAMIGRIANLYGPGQSLEKTQGLISHLALSQLRPIPVSIYVSLDTLRDYIYADDCAELVLDGLRRVQDEPAGATIVKVLCSGQPASIATLLGYLRAVSRRRPNVILGSSSSASLQARDLRLVSTVWPELDRRDLTPLPVGMSKVLRDLELALESSRTR